MFKPFDLPTEHKKHERTVKIEEYGGIADGVTLNTDAIRRAIDDCTECGGRIEFTKGVYLTGPIHFKDNIEIYVSKNVTLKFSTNYNDYLPVVLSLLGGIRCYNYSSLLYANGAENIALTGEGTLDGGGEAWWVMRKVIPKGMTDLFRAGEEGRPLEKRVYGTVEDGVRPRFLQFLSCKNVFIQGVKFINSPSWTIHPVWCENMIIRGVRVKNPYLNAPNTDGINVECCKRVLIEDCEVDTGDDIICLKSMRNEDGWAVGIPCEDIVIRNCVGLNGHGGVTVGSETSADVRNILAYGCRFKYVYSAVRIKTMQGRGGVIEDLEFRDITAEESIDAAILLTLSYTGEPLDDHSKPLVNMPKMRNIDISNITCKKAPVGISVNGVKGAEIENVSLSDINISAERGIVAESFAGLNMKNIVCKEL